MTGDGGGGGGDGGGGGRGGGGGEASDGDKSNRKSSSPSFDFLLGGEDEETSSIALMPGEMGSPVQMEMNETAFKVNIDVAHALALQFSLIVEIKARAGSCSDAAPIICADKNNDFGRLFFSFLQRQQST